MTARNYKVEFLMFHNERFKNIVNIIRQKEWKSDRINLINKLLNLLIKKFLNLLKKPVRGN
jgi:hypothetical protein